MFLGDIGSRLWHTQRCNTGQSCYRCGPANPAIVLKKFVLLGVLFTGSEEYRNKHCSGQVLILTVINITEVSSKTLSQ